MPALPPTPPSRRTVIGAALWSVPAITLATAAPAFADSGQPTLEFNPGDTGVDWNGNLRFSGASITATGRVTPPAQVLMSVTFLAGGRWEMLTPGDAPVAWTGTQEQPGSVLFYTSVASVSASNPVSLEGGRIPALRGGDFRIGFTAPGYTGTRTSFTFLPV